MRNHIASLWTVAILLGVGVFFLSPQLELGQVQAETIKEIVVTGNSKTKTEAIIRRAQIELGANLDEHGLEDLKRRLSQNPQFRLIKIEFLRGRLLIDIEDKWTIIPLPILTQSGEYFNRGILLYENNFLGRLETIIPAVSWTNSGANWILVYNGESLFTPNLGLSGVLINKRDLVEFKKHELLVNRYENSFKDIEVTPNFLYKNMVFKLGPIFLNRKIYDINGVRQFSFQGAGIHMRYHAKYFKSAGNSEDQYDGYFITSNMLVVPAYLGRLYYSGNFEFHSSFPVARNFFKFLGNVGVASDKSHLYPHIMGGDEGFRGYDAQGLPVQRYLSLTLQWQQALWEQIYAVAFTEGNISTLISPIYGGRELVENTYGVGIHYYFKEVAIPGVTVEYARNIQDESDHYHFNLGIKL